MKFPHRIHKRSIDCFCEDNNTNGCRYKNRCDSFYSKPDVDEWREALIKRLSDSEFKEWIYLEDCSPLVKELLEKWLKR